MSATESLIGELDGIEINGPALSDERVAEIIRRKSFNLNEAFYFPKTWLELFRRVAVKDAELEAFRSRCDRMEAIVDGLARWPALTPATLLKLSAAARALQGGKAE